MTDGRWWAALVTFERRNEEEDKLPEWAHGAYAWMLALAPDEDAARGLLLRDVEHHGLRVTEISDEREVFSANEIEEIDDQLASDFRQIAAGTQTVWGKIIGNGQEHRAYQAIERGDYEQARRLLEPVAARNSEYSLLTVGALYEAGNLGPPDLNTALSYYERAANQGSAEAQRRLGRLLVDQGDAGNARTAFERGAESGNVSCMYWLGKLMLEGGGGAVDASRGIEWLERAAAEGHFFAKRELLRNEIRRSRSIFRRWLVWSQIVMLGLKAGRAAATNPDVDTLR